jgi:3-oxoacyl-[acyl-carrier protein] reductase/2-[hydroxy(phenyl)methyl]-succinyl-CoA dehydrogenase BbsD subunit
MGIHNRVTLITGSASGIGKQTARLLAEHGAKVVINDIQAEKVEETVAELKKDGLEAIGQVCNITNKASVDEMIENAVKTFGSIDILVNNAGMERAGALRKLTPEDFDITVGVNLKGAFLCSQAAHNHMVNNQHGRIINIASRAWLGGAGQADRKSVV